MSDAVYVQAIATAGLITIAILGNRKLNRIGADAKEARNQTANTHETNLRDDVDSLAVRVEHLVDGQTAIGKDLGLAMETFSIGADELRAARREINGIRQDSIEIRQRQLADADTAREALERHIREASATLQEHLKNCPPPAPKEPHP